MKNILLAFIFGLLTSAIAQAGSSYTPPSSSGTALISDTNVTVNTRITITAQDNNTTGALRVSARTSGASFVITSSNGADSGVVGYQEIEP